MADVEDLRAAKSGDKDLAGRDLRDANFDGADLSDADLTRANLRQATFRGSNLQRAILIDAEMQYVVMQDADLSMANATATAFHTVALVGAKLIGADFSSSHLTNTLFNRADLRGANFRNSYVNEETDFTDAIVDETTQFDGAHIIRSLARQEAFRFYSVERGRLVRRTTEDGSSVYREAVHDTLRRMVASTGELRIGYPTISSSHRSEYPEIVAAIDKLLADLKEIAPPPPADQATHGGIGHNGPPDDYPLSRDEHDDLVARLIEVRVELHSGDVRQETVEAAANKFDSVGWQIATWVGRKADLAADEFAKNIGKNLADYRQWVAGYMIVSGQLANLSQALATMLGGFTH